MAQAAEVVPVEVVMGKAEAKRLTAAIKRRVGSIQQGTERLGEAVHRAYHEGAWKALGYGSWKQYVAGEFPDVSRGQKYRLVAWSEVTAELEAASSGPVKVSGRKAAAVRKRAPAVADKVREKLAGKQDPTPAERKRAVEEALAEVPADDASPPAKAARARAAEPSLEPSPPAPPHEAAEERPEPPGGADAAPESPSAENGRGAAAGEAVAASTVIDALLLVPPADAVADGVTLDHLDALLAWIGRVRFAIRGASRAAGPPAAKAAAPAKAPAKKAASVAKAQAPKREPSGCKHPVNRRIAGRCLVCGEQVK